MSPSQREAFEQNLKSAEEVACTLVYEEGWSLLRPKKQQVCYVVVTTIKASVFKAGSHMIVPIVSVASVVCKF